ncbi:hypothetical protein BLOT_014339 [Blomia tropicalis]|nr:hypothetical protein BLOT_014339 [Blomia tropicalis]
MAVGWLVGKVKFPMMIQMCGSLRGDRCLFDERDVNVFNLIFTSICHHRIYHEEWSISFITC